MIVEVGKCQVIKGAGIIKAQRGNFLSGVSLWRGKGVFINSLWVQEGRDLQNKFSLCKRLYELVAEIPSKILNSNGKKKVWSYF